LSRFWGSGPPRQLSSLLVIGDTGAKGPWHRAGNLSPAIEAAVGGWPRGWIRAGIPCVRPILLYACLFRCRRDGSAPQTRRALPRWFCAGTTWALSWPTWAISTTGRSLWAARTGSSRRLPAACIRTSALMRALLSPSWTPCPLLCGALAASPLVAEWFPWAPRGHLVSDRPRGEPAPRSSFQRPRPWVLMEARGMVCWVADRCLSANCRPPFFSVAFSQGAILCPEDPDGKALRRLPPPGKALSPSLQVPSLPPLPSAERTAQTG